MRPRVGAYRPVASRWAGALVSQRTCKEDKPLQIRGGLILKVREFVLVEHEPPLLPVPPTVVLHGAELSRRSTG